MEPLVPAGLELDLIKSKCLVSVVGRMVMKPRLGGLALRLPYHQDFEDISIQIYVKRRMGRRVRRGTLVVKGLKPRRFPPLPRRFFMAQDLRGVRCDHSIDRMSHEPKLTFGGRIEYNWKFARKKNHFSLLTEGEPGVIPTSGEVAFLVDRGYGYTHGKDQEVLEFEVQRQPWQLIKVKEYSFHCDGGELFGDSFGFLDREPHSVFVCDGSDVVVKKPIPMLSKAE